MCIYTHFSCRTLNYLKLILEPTMSPAPTETAMQEPGFHLSPSEDFQCLGSSANVCLSNPKSMEFTTQGNSSVVVHASNERCLQKSFTNSPADHLSSSPYNFFLSNSGLNIQNKECSKSAIEKDNCRQRLYTHADTRPLFGARKVKRELFPGTVSQVLADVNKLWDLSVTETEGMHGSPGQKYRLNGRIDGECLSIPLASNYSSSDLTYLEKSPQKLPNEERKAKSNLIKCLNRQQVLINRAKRNKKRLQMLLAKDAVRHCRQQISDFVSYHTRKAKVTSNLIDQLRNDTKISHNSANPSKVASNANINQKKQEYGSLESPSKVGICSVSVPGILTFLERQLDSDATGSSSDEDWDKKSQKISKINAECNWLSMRSNIASRWTWLQAKLLEMEYQIQQLGHLQSRLRSQKGTLVFEEPPHSILHKQSHLPEPGNSLAPAERLATPPKDTNVASAKDFEMSPSSPTMLLQNIEKQSAQLTEMVSNLMASFPIALSPKPYIRAPKHEYEEAGIPSVRRAAVHNSESPMFNGHSQKQPKKEWKKIHAKVPSTFGSSSARTRPLQLYFKRYLYKLGSGCRAMLSHSAVYCCNESLQSSKYSSIGTCCNKLQRPVLVKSNVCDIEQHFHPVLSLPSELPLHLYFGALLKNNKEIRGDAADNTLFIQKEDGFHPHYLNNFPTVSTPESFCDPCKDDQSNARENDFDTVILNALNNVTQTEETSLTSPASQKSSSQIRYPSIVVSGSGTRRRQRSESSYDIDNIVIPMNLVAPIKLEKLQYKEIVTPSYKEKVYQPLETLPDEELEDLSDDMYSRLHEKYEQREKARWSFWQQNKWPKKTRSLDPGFAVWSGKVFPSNEENYSPGYVSPVSWDTLSPNTDEPQNQRPSYELQHDKDEQWEQRIFPLQEAAAVALVNTDKSLLHTSLLTHVENKQQHSQTSTNNWL